MSKRRCTDIFVATPFLFDPTRCNKCSFVLTDYEVFVSNPAKLCVLSFHRQNAASRRSALIYLCDNLRTPVSSFVVRPSQSEAVVYPENGLI